MVPLVLLILASVAAVGIAVSGVATPTPVLNFAQAGHWIAQPGQGTVAHVDGATKSIDARARISGMTVGSQVVQGATSGYVVGDERIVEFGKSTLAVRRTHTPPVDEMPVAIEASGGPFLVYRQAGQVVRLGEAPTTVPTGGPLRQPVVTKNGTLWLQRSGTGVLCHLPPGAKRLSCPTTAPRGHSGELTMVGDRPVFVDSDADELRQVSTDGLGEPVRTGVDLPREARVAPQDAGGRLAVLDDAGKRLHFVDTAGLSGRKAGKPLSTDLPDGAYRGPATSGSAVVLLDAQRNELLTYRANATEPERTPIPAESGEPRISRGEDGRIYVDGAQGRNVMVVDHDGAVTRVPVGGAGADQGAGEANGRSDESRAEPAKPSGRDADADQLPPIAQPPPDRRPERRPEREVTAPARPDPPPARALPRRPEPPTEAAPPPNDPPRAARQDPEPPRGRQAEPPPERPAPRPDPPAPDPEPPAAQPDRPAPDPDPSAPNRPAPNPTPDPPPKPNPPPKPVPASPPGMPRSFSVIYDSYTTNAVASWTAPPANGAPITRYYLRWSEGSRTYPGDTTFVPLPDFGDNEPFRVTLVAENSAGRSAPAVTTSLDGSTNPDCYDDWDQVCWDESTSPVQVSDVGSIGESNVGQVGQNSNFGNGNDIDIGSNNNFGNNNGNGNEIIVNGLNGRGPAGAPRRIGRRSRVNR